MSQLMISVSGIRGLVGSALTPEIVTHYAAAYASWLGPGPIVFGRDSRPSGPVLRHAVLAGLLGAGRDVHEIGIVPTPTVQLQVEHRHAAGGIALTASHNPIEWNALKLIGPSGRFLTKSEGEAFLATTRGGTPRWAGWSDLGSLEEVPDPLDLHLDLILRLPYLDLPAIRERGFRVALDAVHGAGGSIGRRLLTELGCVADILFEEPTGLFPRPPEPLGENLGILAAHVARGRYDVGFAFDPDVDRLSLIDETGQPLGEECTLALCARFVLERQPGPFVTNLSTSAMGEAVARGLGREVHRTPVGEANVVEEIARSGAPIGGEGNGGVILPAVHLGRDAPVGLALILGLMAATGRPLSELRRDLPDLAMVKDKAEFETVPPLGPVGLTLQKGWPGATLDERDGIRLSRDGEWVHVRRSGTEPIVRVIAEAGSPARAQALKDEALKVLRAAARG